MDQSSHLYLLITSLFLLHWLIDYSSANSDINTDRSSLTAFKSRISTDPHEILSRNWSSESTICSWMGVTCYFRYHRVTRLNISSMGLAGTIPPEIGNLSFLVSLDVSENSFHGPIPQSIFNISNLEVLNLRNNILSSSLPLDMCKHNLHRLKRHRISYNKLYGEIPSSLEQCSQLEYLSLRRNNFSGHVPIQIGNLTLLQRLFLGSNNLSGSIPSTFVNQSRLLQLELRSNNLSGEIPPSICNLKSLQILDLSYNSLEGAIPDCLANLDSSALILLYLNANKLSGIIPSIIFSKGCSLESINLNGNKLEGTLPQTLGNCQDLVIVDIGDNKIQGAFPFWMETLPELHIIILMSNKFNGTMSESSKTEQPFPKLQVLDVSYNAFVGSLPDRYFKNFRGMIDAKENMSGDEAYWCLRFMEMKLTLKGLDQLLGRLLNMFTTIDMSSNRFSGSIPPSLGNLNSLRYLNLSQNSIKGHIPSSLGSISLLVSLDFSSNKLDGEIPAELARLTFLEKLNLSMNNLEGQLPQSTQLSTFGNESYVGNVGLCGLPLTRKCEGSDGKPSPPHVEVESDREIEWGYVFAAAGYVVSIGIFSLLLLFCKSFRYKYFEKVDDVFEIFECCQR